MPTLPDRRTPEPELRLIALYVLDRLSPCTDMTLLQFLFQYDLMNFFELSLALADLCKQGHAVRSEEEAAWRYEITEAGRELLSMFKQRIPKSKRDMIDQNLVSWLNAWHKERERSALVRQTKRGEYELVLSLTEHDMELISVTLSLPSESMAKAMAESWKTEAGAVYGAIVGLLKEKKA